jgi:tripartite-type tricarboxylate transporter receptor subunit TctC
MDWTRRALTGALLATPAIARAQAAWPQRPVRLIVPVPAGGGLDVLARALGERLSPGWGQPVVVENRPGGATIPGSDAVAKSAPDGHTLLFTADNAITSNPFLHRTMPFDPMRDLAPVTLLLDVHQMVVVHPGIGARDMDGLVAAARARPGALNYGSYGPGSQPHLSFEALKAQTRTDIVHVVYRGVGPAVLATVANEVQMTLSGIASAREHMAAGTLRALAVGRAERFPQLPDVPTLAEAGYGDIDPRTWFGMLAPAGTPPAVIARIQRDVAAALAEPAIRGRHILPNGYTVHASTPERFAAFLREDLAYKERLIRLSGATLD